MFFCYSVRALLCKPIFSNPSNSNIHLYYHVRYAALTITEVDGKVVYNQELKGLDLVRRDWCPLSKDTGNSEVFEALFKIIMASFHRILYIGKNVVDLILSGKPKEEIVSIIHEQLAQLATNARAGSIDLAQFVVTKGLNKNPRDYPDHKSQPHLQVALKMLSENKPVNIGDHIPYVICKEGTEGSTASMRAHHPDEVFRSQGALTVDVEWYLAQQILPPISRLCEPIDGTSVAQISLQLGLDASKFVQKSTTDDFQMDWGFTPRCMLADTIRFKDCIKLNVTCKSCKSPTEFPGVFSVLNTSGLSCTTCGAMYYGLMTPAACYGYLSNCTTLLVRQMVKKYYDCWLRCDDMTCGRRTTQQSVNGYGCVGNCHGRMKQEYSESELHTQLKYLESLFDVERAKEKCANTEDLVLVPPELTDHQKEIFKLLKIHMSNTVENNAYNWIRPSLWSKMFGRSTSVSMPSEKGIGNGMTQVVAAK